MLPEARTALLFATSHHVPCFLHHLTLGPLVTISLVPSLRLNSDFHLRLLKSLELAVLWIKPFPSWGGEGSFSGLHQTILQGQKQSGSFVICSFSRQISSEILPLYAQNMCWGKWWIGRQSLLLQELTDQQQRLLALTQPWESEASHAP